MGNLFLNDYNEEENLSMIIRLSKSCYYPGETLSGKIILQMKTNKISSTFNFPKSIISITQFQQYQFYLDNILLTEKDQKTLISKFYNFKKYKSRQILTPLTLPFSIQIPLDTAPTFIHEDSNFIKHILRIEFPQIKCKKSIGIIIQNRQIILKDNCLYKTSTEKFRDIHKSAIFRKNSQIAFLFRTEKNSYSYNEMIPFEIIMNCYESQLAIERLRVTLTRNIYFRANDKIDSKIILMKNYELPKKINKQIFKMSSHFLFPLVSDYFSVNPMNIYNNYNQIVINDFDKSFIGVNLFPTCLSSLFICSYSLNVEIIFKSFFIKNERLSIPIELYTPLKIDDIKNNIKSINNEIKKDELVFDEETRHDEGSLNDMLNNDNEINNINIDTGNFDSGNFDFEIINKEDFYKILTEEKNSKLIN